MTEDTAPGTITIDALGHEGDGVAATAAGQLYVPFALPGETVTVRPERGAPGRARLDAVLKPASDRVVPPCPHFGACGGCALQHQASDATLAWKRLMVVAAFAQRGIDAPVGPVAAVGPGQRRRAVFQAVRTAAGVVFGFSRRGSNDILPIRECVVLQPEIVSRFDDLRRIAESVLKPGRRLRLAVLATATGLDIAVDGAGRLDRRQAIALAGAAAMPGLARLTVDGETILQAGEPVLHGAGFNLFPPPGGFAQAAAPAEAALGEAVEAALDGCAAVADLFAGIGTFTLRLARTRRVLAVEGDAAAVAALDRAVRHAAGLKPVTVRRRDLFRNPVSPPELVDLDGAVFDPPRAGARAQAEMLAASPGLRRIAAVSCNPATLARDARVLIDGGFTLDWVRPVDQFVYSPHVEAVAAFSRA